MLEGIGSVGVYSEDLSYHDLRFAISENHDDIQLSVYEEENCREFTNVEWITFILMAIPATESVVNIVNKIKKSVKTRLLSYMKKTKSKKTVIVKLKINLPFFSYERDEELIVEPVEED